MLPGSSFVQQKNVRLYLVVFCPPRLPPPTPPFFVYPLEERTLDGILDWPSPSLHSRLWSMFSCRAIVLLQSGGIFLSSLIFL